MKTRTWLVVGILTIAFAAPGVMLAADSAAFNKADRNGDFMITPDELGTLPDLKKGFREFDRDHNGYLDSEEFERGVAETRLRQAMVAG